jgi:hypothetical protein
MTARQLSALKLFVALPLAALALVSALTGCETGDDRQIAAGQACLDGAKTSGDADTCVATVQGLTSSDSYLIRCSANFIAQGFTTARLASAFQKLKDGNSTASGASPTVSLISYLVFAKTLPNHTIALALSNCQASGVSSMYRLAVAANLATTVVNLTGGITPNTNPDDPSFNADSSAMLARLQTLYTANNATNNAAIGTIAVTADSSYCNDTSAFKTSDVCKTLDAALAGGADPATAGRALLAGLQPH